MKVRQIKQREYPDRLTQNDRMRPTYQISEDRTSHKFNKTTNLKVHNLTDINFKLFKAFVILYGFSPTVLEETE